jgi:hypothetical protein
MVIKLSRMRHGGYIARMGDCKIILKRVLKKCGGMRMWILFRMATSSVKLRLPYERRNVLTTKPTMSSSKKKFISGAISKTN